MAGQQQQIIDTIFNMKRRLLRNDDSSDGDESDTPYNSRKQSLKRKAIYTRSGKPEFASDPPPYKKRIEHAGYHRYILQRNPPKFDPDGDIVEPGDEYEDEDDLSAVEENPYADIKLEELLAPLTSAADLPNHPGYRPIYTSKHLTNLTAEAGAIARKEQVLLAGVKTVFNKLLGDPSFVPNSVENLLYGENLQDPWVEPEQFLRAKAINGLSHNVPQPEATGPGDTQGRSEAQDVIMVDDAEPPTGAPPNPAVENQQPGSEAEPTQNGNSHKEDTERKQVNGDGPPSPPADDASETASQLAAHRMTTRAQAQAASDLSPPPSPSSAGYVHPFFTYPTDMLPDRDLGLPAAEAEDTRMLLLAFVQKQEEIARTATDLYLGMQQGERMRQDVFKWCKAEGHVGEMSDGEDWYDKEEWGLEEDLAKGRDEEEDDTQVQGKKSTRQRRTKDKDDR